MNYHFQTKIGMAHFNSSRSDNVLCDFSQLKTKGIIIYMHNEALLQVLACLPSCLFSMNGLCQIRIPNVNVFIC